MRARLATLLILLLTLAVPLQGLLASAGPGRAIAAADAAQAVAVLADEAGHDDASPCHGHDDGAVDNDADTAATNDASCGCCVACGAVALPAAAPSVARNDLRCTTAAAPPAPALAFVTEGPERPPRG